ncbi:MAG: hypothetical protein M1819_002290 [Sarea resinae]|nr:MAG: hypothetical protein M1819_002290 [Sarea resinae]
MSSRRPQHLHPPGPQQPMPSISSKFSLRHLLETPPPSPGLPSLTPRHGKKPSPRRYKSLVRLGFWFCSVALLLWCVVSLFDVERISSPMGPSAHEKAIYELAGDGSASQDPSAVMVVDKRGRARWTVSIPPWHNFPLRAKEYQDICEQSAAVIQKVNKNKSPDPSSHHPYYHIDPNFLDVAEAEEEGLLPWGEHAESQRVWGAFTGNEQAIMRAIEKTSPEGEAKECETSLTYVMDGSEAGLGKMLMGMWMAYGLAKKEGRAFFLDDSHWCVQQFFVFLTLGRRLIVSTRAYGKYSTYFTPPPIPSCLPPPKTRIIPCPHHARHLLVSAATSHWTFGTAFLSEFQDSHAKSDIKREKRIFALLRDGYEALFHLQPENANYVANRVRVLKAGTTENGGLTVGIHVRRGDRHPLEYQYHESYIPLDRYLEAARELVLSHANKTTISSSSFDPISSSKLVLASDDPDVYDSPEFMPPNSLRAQDLILLASKNALDAASSEPKQNPYIDETIGWEGGFFKDIFWSLGQDTGSSSSNQPGTPNPTARSAVRASDPSSRTHTAADNDDGEAPIPELALRLRELVGRAYLLDLAVLGHMDRVVCTIGAAGCRALGVMLGWDGVAEMGRLVDIDGGGGWRGVLV